VFQILLGYGLELLGIVGAALAAWRGWKHANGAVYKLLTGKPKSEPASIKFGPSKIAYAVARIHDLTNDPAVLERQALQDLTDRVTNIELREKASQEHDARRDSELSYLRQRLIDEAQDASRRDARLALIGVGILILGLLLQARGTVDLASG